MSRSMTPTSGQVIRRALLTGFAAGLRSMTPIGVLAAERNDASLAGGWKGWPVLSSPTGRVLLQASAIGEMVVDKLPFVPPRTAPQSLWARLVSGGVAGLAMGTVGTGSAVRAAALVAGVVGVVGSLAGSYGGQAYRGKVTKLTGLPDLPVALVEDVAAVLIARKGVRG